MTDFNFEVRKLNPQMPMVIDRMKGAKPGDLPVRYADHYRLSLSMRAASRLGLALPPSILAQAERVVP